jgi:hypothetical protein
MKYCKLDYDLNMDLLKKLWRQWRFALPIILIMLGIILNGYAVVQFFWGSLTTSPPDPSITITQPLKATTPTPNITADTKVLSVKDIEPGIVVKQKFGHFPYPEGDADKMITIGSYAQNEYQRFEQHGMREYGLFPYQVFALLLLKKNYSKPKLSDEVHQKQQLN